MPRSSGRREEMFPMTVFMAAPWKNDWSSSGTSLLLILENATQSCPDKEQLNHKPGASHVAQWVKNLPAVQEMQVRSLGREDPLEEGIATHSSILGGKSHGQRSLAGYSPWGHKGSDATEWLNTRTHTIPNLLSQLSWKYLWLSVWGSDFESSSVCAHDLSQSTATQTLCASVSAFQENGYHSLWSFSSVSKVSLVWTPQCILSQAIPSIPPNLVKSLSSHFMIC